jgi:hypothetical protein
MKLPSDYLFHEMLRGYEDDIAQHTVAADLHSAKPDAVTELRMIRAANEVNMKFARIEGYILGLKSAIIALANELKIED